MSLSLEALNRKVEQLRRGSRGGRVDGSGALIGQGVGSFTCTPSVAQTDLVEPLILLGLSEIVFAPRTQTAAAEVATTWVEFTGNGQMRVHHANNAITDRTFSYVIYNR